MSVRGSDSAIGSPTVRAVVVTWNGAHLLRPCLDSLLAQDLARGTLDIVVVDNASSDGTRAMLARDYPDIEVRVNPENLGFAGGVNVGLIDLQQDYAVLLNNDATFEPEAVSRLIEHLEKPANVGVAAATAQILLTQPDAAGRTLVNSTGNVLTRHGSAADRDWLVPVDSLAAPVDVFGFCGGASALRRTALEDVGLFDRSLFLYYEDTDLSWRMRANGWSIHYVSSAVAHHRHAASSGTASAVFRYYNTRNSLIVLSRHAPWASALLSTLRQTAGALQHQIVRDEKPEVLRARWRALRDFSLCLPTILGQRRRVWSGQRVWRRHVYRRALSRG